MENKLSLAGKNIVKDDLDKIVDFFYLKLYDDAAN